MSRNKFYYSRKNKTGCIDSAGKKVQIRQYSAPKHSSVYAWLQIFAQNFQLSPDSDSIHLPFSCKQQVFVLYCMQVQSQNGISFFCSARSYSPHFLAFLQTYQMQRTLAYETLKCCTKRCPLRIFVASGARTRISPRFIVENGCDS